MHAPRSSASSVHLAKRLRARSAAFLALVGIACADNGVAPVRSTAVSVNSTASAVSSEAADRVAQGLALALADPSARAMLRDAMRASRVKEHKLVLQEFTKTPVGRQLVSRIAKARKTSTAAVEADIAALEPLDLYLPFADHRKSWRATPEVRVAVTFDEDAPSIAAYGTDGSTMLLRQDAGTPTMPLIIMHPSEPAYVRPGSGAVTPGEVVQDSDELSRESAAQARMQPMQLATLATGVYIQHLNIQEGDGWFGTIEPQFQSYSVGTVLQWYGDHGQFPIFEYACNIGNFSPYWDVSEDKGYEIGGPWLLSSGVSSLGTTTCNGNPGTYAIRIIEVDGGLNGNNDEYGWRFYIAGALPFGAMPGVDVSYYKNTWPQYFEGSGYHSHPRSAYLRIILQ